MQPLDESGLRQRQGLATSTDGEGSSRSDEQVSLTPSSTGHNEDSQEASSQTPSSATWWSRLVLDTLQQNVRFSEKKKRPHDFEEKREYHKIKPSKCTLPLSKSKPKAI